MRNILFLIITALIACGCSNDDEETKLDFDILCSCKVSSKFSGTTKNVSCNFFAFPEGNYSKVEIATDDFGTAYAFNTNGEKIKNIGYAYYSEDKEHYATLMNYNLAIGNKAIREGTFYIACFPLTIGYRHPYKAKNFTKVTNKALIIEPIFAEDEYYGIDGYQYFEWD